MRVLISDAHTPTAVAAVRSLGRRGHEPIVASSEGGWALAATSRYCRGLVTLPDPASAPGAYADGILREIRRGDYDAFLPLSDSAFVACAAVRAEIESAIAYCAAPQPAIEASTDKWRILLAGASAGLSAPPARLVTSETEGRDALESIPPPVVLRSRRSILRRGGRLVKPRTEVVFESRDARESVRRRLDEGEQLVLSAFREGRGRGVYLFMSSGRPAIGFGHLRLRETNPCGSPACAALSLEPTAVELAGSAALLAGLGVEGAAMVEFRRDEGSGATWLIEVNPRLWGSISLAIGAGLDFPAWQVEYFARGRIPSADEPAAAGTGARYLSAEIAHLLHAWGGPPRGWKAPYPGWSETWRAFVRDFGKGFRFYHQEWADPIPGIVEPLAYAVNWWRARTG